MINPKEKEIVRELKKQGFKRVYYSTGKNKEICFWRLEKIPYSSQIGEDRLFGLIQLTKTSERQRMIKEIEKLHDDYTFKPIIAVDVKTDKALNFIDLIKQQLKTQAEDNETEEE